MSQSGYLMKAHLKRKTDIRGRTDTFIGENVFMIPTTAEYSQSRDLLKRGHRDEENYDR